MFSLGNLIKQLAIENGVTEEIVEKSIDQVISSAWGAFSNDKYSLWKTIFGEKRPSAEEFLEKTDDFKIKK